MYKTENKPCTKPFTFKLEDCLACSSCISDFSNNIPTIKDLKTKPFSFLISIHSKINMYFHYKKYKNVSYVVFECILTNFLKHIFQITKIIDTSFYQYSLNKQVYEESNMKKIIISDCPGTVAYIESQGVHLIQYLSKVYTQQQISASNLKNVVSVVQCYDKKMENGRDCTNIEYILTTFEFYNLIIENGFLEFDDRSEIFEWEKSYGDGNLYGYLDYIKTVDNLNIKTNYPNFSLKTVSKPLEIKLNGKRNINKNNIREEFLVQCNGLTKKYLRIIGLEHLINFIKDTKINGLNYDVCEIYICSNGCLNGPGQVFFDEKLEKYFLNDSKIDLNIEKKEREYKEIKIRKKYLVEW